MEEYTVTIPIEEYLHLVAVEAAYGALRELLDENQGLGE